VLIECELPVMSTHHATHSELLALGVLPSSLFFLCVCCCFFFFLGGGGGGVGGC